ncbi:MAG TPA: nucleoside triphosphate pyrophosphohydrolase [Atribacteraceae bacterium]|nr:nucleoside triphosphate pyrophosphohydrolase [Atribacteraceae bacterium]
MDEKSTEVLFRELLETVDILRGEGGCPWDREQTRETLKQLMVEEVYEALEAIDRQDDAELMEELGDMLLHIVFHARIGQEEGSFTMADVLRTIVSKMKKRHPHVFGSEAVAGVDGVLVNWERIKGKEKERESMLSSLPRHLPALVWANAIQSRVARVGFDWKNAEAVADKVEEEWKELREAWRSEDGKRIEAEWGDLAFTLVNLARHLKVDPEEALRKTCHRFKERFAMMEGAVRREGKNLVDVSFEELDKLWDNAKENLDPKNWKST